MGLFDGVRIYPISQNKTRSKLLGFSSSVDPFCVKICNLLSLKIVMQVRKTSGPNIHRASQENVSISNSSEIILFDGRIYQKSTLVNRLRDHLSVLEKGRF